ncbi:MAG: hypothetical protein ACXVRS_11990 [Gaiellaceae bacterium]
MLVGMLCAFAVGLGAAMLAAADSGKDGLRSGDDGSLTMAVYGDAPYGTNPTDTAELSATPAFIKAVNSDHSVRLVVHVGDIHSGKQYCTFAYDNSVFDLWTQFRDPLVYTPGDNETADCHKTAEGGNVLDGSGSYVDYANGDPVANLGLIRQIFFAEPGRTLGGGSMKVLSQARAFDPAHPDDAQFVENVMWEQSKALFVTIDLPGGSNNEADVWYGASAASGEQTQEARLRTQADLDWLDAAYKQAAQDHVSALVIVTQADMWDTTDTPAHEAGYEPIVKDIAANTTAFGKPVLLFNGDSHIFRSDNPLVPGSPCSTESKAPDNSSLVACTDDAATLHQGYNVPNFHRIVVHGSTFPLEYLRVTVNAGKPPAPSSTSFGPFSWTRVQPS